MPPKLSGYIHRVGRTARAGSSGRSVSFIGVKDRKLLKEILKRCGTTGVFIHTHTHTHTHTNYIKQHNHNSENNNVYLFVCLMFKLKTNIKPKHP
jgi:superfamily II DNA/RNA helicase